MKDVLYSARLQGAAARRAVVIGAGLSVGGAAPAQSARAGVTAEMRAEELSNVPIAITVGDRSGVTVSLDGVSLLDHFPMNPAFQDVARVRYRRF